MSKVQKLRDALKLRLTGDNQEILEMFETLVKEHEDKIHHLKEEMKGGNPEVCLYKTDFCELTLDPNTANRNLKLSDNNTKVERVDENQSYPDHLDRFDLCPQVLCTIGLTGRCYWEVEWRGNVSIAVTYRGIKRKGESKDCLFGCNSQSWSLLCSDRNVGYCVCHNKRPTVFRRSSSSSNRVLVFLDYPAGTLSFYEVTSDSLIHIHTFSCTFTEPLYAGFWFWSRSSVSVCRL